MHYDVPGLDELLENSAATAGFREAVTALKNGLPQTQISHSPGAPSVKVLRVIAKLLEEEPELEIATINVEARSGCSSFVGTVSVNQGAKQFSFDWDCLWKAEKEGLLTFWGAADQTTAAQQFGYRCFRAWKPTAQNS